MRQDEMPLETTCPPFYLMQKQEGNDNGTTGGGKFHRILCRSYIPLVHEAITCAHTSRANTDLRNYMCLDNIW